MKKTGQILPAFRSPDKITQVTLIILVAGLLTSALNADPKPASQEPTVSAQQQDSFRVMSFNIRYGSADDGENSWEYRKQLVVEIIGEYQPQLVGLQEALKFQIEAIIEALPEYDYVGVGRDDGKEEGEYSAILYLKDRYRVLGHNTFWLSDSPRVPGSTSWGNSIPRIVTWAKLDDTQLGRKVYLYNTHFDHRSQPSREKSALLLAERVRGRDDPGVPAVITGDFNAGEYNSVVRYLVEDQPINMSSGASVTNPQPFKDTFRTRHPEAVKVGTFNRFEGYSVGEKIDYVFSTGQLEIISAMIIRDNDQGRYPSDHFPVMADFAF